MKTRIVAFALIAMAACGPNNRDGGDDDPSIDAMQPECVDGMHRCSGTTFEVCSSGIWATQEDCAVGCSVELGCVACSPGNDVCQDGNVHSCTVAGEVGPETTACTGSNICQNGACVDACADAAEQRSYTGCEYWAVDLDNAIEVQASASGGLGCVFSGGTPVMMNACLSGTTTAGGCDPGGVCPTGFTCTATTVCALDAQHSPFAIVVSNPQARAVDVTVTGPEGTTFTSSIAAGAVQPLMPQMNAIPDQSVDGTGLTKKAYKVTSSLPIVAYQFNPLNNVDVFSNDASLLLPRTAFDTEYYVMSYPSRDRRTPAPGKDAYVGFATVVAWQDGTQVEVTPKVNVFAGPGVTAITAGTPTMFTLDAFDVLNLEAIAPGDLTGTRIRATGTSSVGVFGGHEAAGFGEMTPPNAVNTVGPCCADHLEDMMFPTSTWGKAFGITRSQSRGANEPDMLRVMAQTDGTTITFIPPPLSGTCGTLAAGAFCEVKIQVDTSVTSNNPVMIGHYLQSAIWQDPFFGDAIGEGDPSMAIAVPSEQYRDSYTVLIPSQYAKNYLSITGLSAGAVLVDGVAVTLTPFAGGTYRASRTMVGAGQHKIQCPAGCGVEVYGYGDAVSYMFAGGLDLKQIVIE